MAMLNESRKQVVIDFSKLKVVADIPFLDICLKDSKPVYDRDSLNFHAVAVQTSKMLRWPSINMV